jgi:AcrR family transcriptional regulator
VEAFVREYLSVHHRDNPADGCPSAALLDEIARSSDATKQTYTDGLLAVINDAALRLNPRDPASVRTQALSVFALMVGTLQLSRALSDRALADQVIEQGLQNALSLLGVKQPKPATAPRRAAKPASQAKPANQSKPAKRATPAKR